jgi:hypothetical protein
MNTSESNPTANDMIIFEVFDSDNENTEHT